SLLELPLLEGLAVPDCESGHEVIAIEGRGVFQVPNACGARGIGVCVGAHALKVLREAPDVYLHLGRSGERHDVAAQLEPLAVQRTLERRERAAQRCAGTRLVVLCPEQGGDDIAALGPISHGQIGQKSDRLPGIDLNRLPVYLDAWRPEQLDR